MLGLHPITNQREKEGLGGGGVLSFLFFFLMPH